MKLKIFSSGNLLVFAALVAAWYVIATVISPFLHYQLQQSAFITDRDFLQRFSDYPGGIADYCSLFVSQFFFFNYLGSFLIVAFISIKGLLAIRMTRMLIGKSKFEFGISALFILFGTVVFFDYLYPYYISIRLLFAVLFTWAFCAVHLKYPKYSYFVWFVLASLLFYLASGPALFVFALSTVFIYLKTNTNGSKWVIASAFALFAGLLPYLGFKFVFQSSFENLYKISIMKPPASLAYTPEVSTYVFYSLLPLILLGVFISTIIPERKAVPVAKGKKAKVKSKFFQRELFVVLFQVIVVSVLGYFLFNKAYNPLKKNLLTIEYYAEQRQWKKVLETTKYIEEYDFRVNFHGARALSHLRLLPDQLFEYPQLLGTYGLFIDANMARSASIITSDLYFDLGYMGESQHWAFEAQTLLPDSPRILKRLVMINLINRNYLLAEKFLRILDGNMLCCDWVRQHKQFVTDTSLTNSDSLIVEKRRFNPVKPVINTGDEGCLKLLVETSKENRMAYDYLLSFYLLDTNLRGFIEYLKYYPLYGVKTLPRSWEEALIIFVAQTKTVPHNFSPQIVDEKIVRRFAEFSAVIRQNNNNLPVAKNALYSKYGNTYWFYNLYLNPKVTNALSKKAEVK